MMEANFDYEVTYIPFPGGGTVAKNLIGKHIDLHGQQPVRADGVLQGRPEPSAGPVHQPRAWRRSRTFPTAKELGHDIEYYMQRSINGPPGMSAEAREWYINLFKTLYESEEWQTFCTDDGLDCTEWVGGDDLAAFHAEQLKRHKKT